MSDILVPNELLSFLQQKLDVMDEVSAIQICATNFSEEDIAASKLQLYTLLNKRDQMVSRRRDGTKKSLHDIITLLKETDPDDVPTFVAKDLNKLPPVTFDHVNVTSLLKDIVFLKTRLADVQKKLCSSETIVANLRKEVDELRKNATRSPTCVNVNTRRGARRLDTTAASYASAVLSTTPTNAETAERADNVPHNSAPAPAVPPHTAACATKPPGQLQIIKSNTPKALVVKTVVSEKVPGRGENDGFVTVQKKKRRQRTNKNCCGTGPEESQAKIRAAKPNTPVYISRLHYTTEVDDIVEYVHRKLKYRPRVQLLESLRNVNFKAFVLRIPNCYLQHVMDSNFWPQNVVFRRFRGLIPSERKP